MPCKDTFTCVGADPIVATWTPSSGSVSGYRIYYTPGTWAFCDGTWTAGGAATLMGSVGLTTHSWTGVVPSYGGKLSVVAFNASGSSAARFSSPVDPMEYVCP